MMYPAGAEALVERASGRRSRAQPRRQRRCAGCGATRSSCRRPARPIQREARSTRSSPTSTGTAGCSAPSSSATARATCSTRRASRSTDASSAALADSRRGTRICRDRRPRTREHPSRRARQARRQRAGMPGPPEGHPSRTRHALRRLPLQAGQPRQRQALRRAAHAVEIDVRRLPRHDHAATATLARAARRAAAARRRRTAATAARDLSEVRTPSATRDSSTSSARPRDLIQRSMVDAGPEWEVPQVKDSIDPDAPGATTRKLAPGEDDAARRPHAGGNGPASDAGSSRTPTSNMTCTAVPHVVDHELLRLPPVADGEPEEADAPQRGRR